MPVSINMHVDTRCGATKNPLKGPLGKQASECVSRNLFLHLHVPSKAGDATLNSLYKNNVCSPELGPLICSSIKGF